MPIDQSKFEYRLRHCQRRTLSRSLTLAYTHTHTHTHSRSLCRLSHSGADSSIGRCLLLLASSQRRATVIS